MKVQIFPAIGGPLHGHRVTEQYAGPDYHRYNSADGKVRCKCAMCQKGLPRFMRAGLWRHSAGPTGRLEYVCRVQDPHKPTCVLVHKSIWESQE